MSKIKIMQYLCPRRHCITALAFDPATTTEEQAKTALKTFTGAAINPWCGICGSRDLRFEIGETKFDSMAEAAPFLAAEAEKNAQTRAFFEQFKKAAKNN